MTLATGMINLLKDAEYFGLATLEKELRRAGASTSGTALAGTPALDWVGEIIPLEERSDGEKGPLNQLYFLRDVEIRCVNDQTALASPQLIAVP